MLIEIGNPTLENDAHSTLHTDSERLPRIHKEHTQLCARVLPRPERYHWYLPCKRVVEFMVALVLLVLGAPWIWLFALVVKLTSRGPAFYTQSRMGRHGRPFVIYKIRTMIHECESLTGPRWSIPGDPRITWMGSFLRRSHLDELPQLLNVLRGDMSLIGPRPERPEFMPELVRAYPNYGDRLAVRPGVTGLAQIQLPADQDLAGVRRKLVYDLYYIQHLSPWLDLRILLCTLPYALGIPFRFSRRLLRIPSGEVVERTRQTLPIAGPVTRQRKSA